MDSSSGTLKKSLISNDLEQQKSVPTGVSIAQENEAPKRRKIKLFNPSVLIVAFVIFAICSSQGLLIVAVWPLCHELGGNKIHLGFIMAIHALGKGLAAHPFSSLTEKYKHKLSLSVGCAFLLVGGFLFAFCPYLGGLAMLFIAKLMLGISFGAIGPARGFVAEQTRPDRRTYVLSRLAALEYSGCFATALIGALLVALGGVISEELKFFLPALLVSATALVGLYVLYHSFEDIKAENELTEEDFNPLGTEKRKNSPKTTPRAKGEAVDDVEQSSPSGQYTPPGSPHAYASASVVAVGAAATGVLTGVDLPKSQSVVSVESASTVSTAEEQRIEAERQQVTRLILLLNFVLRSVLAVYCMISGEIMLNIYETSYYAVGGMITFAGVLGTAQLAAFKPVWTNNFSDALLFLVGFGIVGFSQILVVNWTPTFDPSLWSFVIAFESVIGIGAPVAMGTAMGAFSVMQRTGHQSDMQAQLLVLEAGAFMVVPILVGVLEECVRKFTSFSLLMVLLGATIVGVMQAYEVLMRFTDRGVLRGKTLSSTESGFGLENVNVRRFFTVIAGFLTVGGCVTFLISCMGGRV